MKRNKTKAAINEAAKRAVGKYGEHGKAQTIKALREATGIGFTEAERAVKAVHRVIVHQILS